MPNSKDSARAGAAVDHLAGLRFSVWHNRPVPMARAHTHPDVEINCLASGRVRYFASGRFHDLGPGDVAIFWGGMPHQALEAEKAEGTWLTLPLMWLLKNRNLSPLSDRLLTGQFIKVKGTAMQQALFAQWREDYRDGRAVLRDIVAGEVAAFLARLSLGLAGKSGGGRKSSGPAHRVEQVTRYLALHYTEDIRVLDVARDAGLHPKYLLAFFRKACGISLWNYVVLLRLGHAQRLLATTDRTVTDIALEAGFGSLNAFYHAFRKHLPGLSPKAIRQSESESAQG